MAASVVAAGKLAAALHRRTHRVTSLLAHAALEWVLIALLLTNGLLAYAIARFADYFGLAPPCLLCSRVDRLFHGEKGARPLRDVLCGEHAAEISALGYCLRHHLLAEACSMCEGCLASWKEVRSGGAGEKGGAAVACSCYQAVVVRNSSLREMQGTKEDHDYVEEKITEEDDKEEEEEDHGYALIAQDEYDDEEDEKEEHEDVEKQQQLEEEQGQQQEDEKKAAVEDGSLEAMAQGDEITAEDDRLVPVVALDEMTIADESGLHRDVEEGYSLIPADDEEDSSDVEIGVVLEEKMMLNSAVATPPADAIIDSVLPVSTIPHPEIAASDPDEDSVLQVEDTVEIEDSTAEEEHIAVPQVTEAVPEDDNRAVEVDTNCEVSIGSEICEHESTALEEPAALSAAQVEQSSTLESLHVAASTEQEGDEEVEPEKLTDTTRLDHLPEEQTEAEEDKAPETPTYGGVATQRSDRMFLLERKRSLSLSMDGSVASDMDGVEPSSVDQLRSALHAERKALSALYAELEEERNAAAVATNQTMAMINRLQEEKAAMQMEALQYQRMMEEQSEYDQEALQLLNELVTKREREKQEMERELEQYRQKLQHYEDRERKRMAGFRKANGVSVSPSGSGSSLSSSGDDSDEDCELGESPDGSGNLQSSSDAALISPGIGQDGASHLVALDDSLTYFEMERLSILEELKTLEERLFTLEDDDVKTGNAGAARSSSDFDLSAVDLRSPPEYGFAGDKTKLPGRTSISRGKSLLPLFDAVGDENSDQMTSATVGGAEADNLATKSVSVQEKEQERLAIIEEVDHVYERLQALEADKEFLRHCIKSLKKGDKGMNLLQEILQHLRELRNVDLQVRNAGDAFAANSA